MNGLQLVRLTADRQPELVDMLAEYEEAGEDRFRGLLKLVRRDIHPYLQFLARHDSGADLPAGRVPSTEYWLVNEDRTILGSSRLRSYLNQNLTLEGGHIGYGIRPSQRRKGYGKAILRLTLEKAKELGLERVLVTCDVDNVASSRIIESNGGVLENEAISEATGKPIYRFWIDLTGDE